MTTQTESPFAVRPEPQGAAPTAAQPAVGAVAIASFSYGHYRKAMIAMSNKVGGALSAAQTSIESLEEEDLAFDEQGAYDEDFDHAAHATLTDVIEHCQQVAMGAAQIAERAAKMQALIQGRIDAPPEEE